MSAQDLAAFLARAAGFLDSIAGRRAPRQAGYGQGSDRVTAMEETGGGTDGGTEQEAVAAAKQLQARLFDAGYGWLDGPAELGGAGLTGEHATAFDTLLHEYELPSRMPLWPGLDIVAPAILAHGAPALAAELLPGIHRGDILACQLFSEPGAGSDLASVRTRARLEGEEWVLDGQKVWTSGGHLADVGEALVRTEPDAPKHAGLTMVMVDMHAPGVTVRPLRQMAGGSGFNEVFLDGVRVPVSRQIGDRGTGWRVARTTLAGERASLGADTGPLSARVRNRLADLVRHEADLADPAVRARLAQLVATITALNSVMEADEEHWGPRLAPVGGSISKMLLVRALDQAAALVTEALGPDAFIDPGRWGTHAWSEFVLSVPGMHIAGGTDEIQRTVIAQRGLGLPR